MGAPRVSWAQALLGAAALLGCAAALQVRGASAPRRPRRARRRAQRAAPSGSDESEAVSVTAAATTTARPGFERVLFVEFGWGCDQHGQDATKACVRAARNAIEFNSLPSISALVPGGYDGMKLAVDVAVPAKYRASVDAAAVTAVFPYGAATVHFQDGGALFHSGVAVPALGDATDEAVVAVVAVTVGY